MASAIISFWRARLFNGRYCIVAMAVLGKWQR